MPLPAVSLGEHIREKIERTGPFAPKIADDTPQQTSIYPPGFSYGAHRPIVGVDTTEPRPDEAALERPVVF